jgi:hypothetical protein
MKDVEVVEFSAEPEPEAEVGGPVAQRLYEEVMERHPELQKHAELMSVVVGGLVEAVYHEAKTYVTSNLIQELSDFWTKKANKPVPKKVIKALAKDSSLVYGVVVSRISQDTLDFIAAFRNNDLIDPEDPEDRIIGIPKGNS